MKFKINSSTIYSALLALIIFLVPSNLFLKFLEGQSYVNGLQIDYLIPKIYLSDIFILLILIIWFLQNFKRVKIKLKSKQLFFYSLLFIFFSYQFLSKKPIASLWYLFKILEFSLFAFFIAKHKKILNLKIISFAVLTSLLFQSLLAIYQFHAQASFLNYLFLGETNLNNYIGLAKASFNGVEQILPYGSTAHPNILAGFLVIYLFVSTKLVFKYKYFYLLISALSLYALWLTQSVSAWLALLLAIIIIFLNKYKNIKINNLVLLFIFISSPLFINQLALKYPQSKSLTRRALLNQSATYMFTDNLILGVGLNNFTARVEEYSLAKETTRFVQPVHHLGLLILSETGLLGLVIIILLWKLRIKNYALILLPIASLDHYLVTNQTGLLLLILFFSTMESAQE